MNRLLIISCSMRKRTGAHPARDLYDGSAYRVLRRRASHNLPFLILSAEHGLIPPDTVLDSYDRKMDERQAAILSSASAILTAEKVVRGAVDFPLESVFCYGGALYRQVVESYEAAGVFGNIEVGYSCGRIGEQLAQLKHFLMKDVPLDRPRFSFWRGSK